MLEQQIEEDLITKLTDLKYTYRPDIRDQAALEGNFREKFEALNKVRLTEREFPRLINLNISRSVSTAEPEPEIDLAAVHGELLAVEEKIERATAEHNAYLKELRLPPLP